MAGGQKIVVVTGGERGIGEATVARFAREGAQVVSLDLNVDLSSKSMARLRIACDVSDAAAVDAAFDRIRTDLGGVDVLVNNAGVQHYGTVVDTPVEEWDRVLGANLKSVFLCAKRAIPLMLARDGGCVVNISSVQAFVSQNNVAPYTTSKTAILGLTRSIAADFAPKVRCVAVCPGTIDTPMLRWAVDQSPDPEAVRRECEKMHPVGRLGYAAEVADLVEYLASDRAGFITGQYFRIDGGLGISVGGSKRS